MRIFEISCKNLKLELGKKTCIMGILNVTPDSFSDGGQFFNLDIAVDHAYKMVEDGADIIDIGGESTRPFAEPVSVEDEIDRVVPVIEKIAKHIPVPISIDTSKAIVAKIAIEAGASIVNDISSCRDPEMTNVVREADIPVILMHMLRTPETMQIKPDYSDSVVEIKQYLKDKIDQAVLSRIHRSKIIIDPGIGFGKTVEHNLQILKHINQFFSLGVPILIGTSRKSFIQKIIGISNPLDPGDEIGTQATVSASILGGAHIVRVHDVANTKTTVQILDSIRNA